MKEHYTDKHPQFTHFDLQNFEFRLQPFSFFHFLVVFLLQLLQCVICETQTSLSSETFSETWTQITNISNLKYPGVCVWGQELVWRKSSVEWTTAGQRRMTKMNCRWVENDPSHFCTWGKCFEASNDIQNSPCNSFENTSGKKPHFLSSCSSRSMVFLHELSWPSR